MPENKNYLCWNHILRDVRHWVKSQSNTDKRDVKTYVNHTWDLLDSSSPEIFKEKYLHMSGSWSKEFRHYFDTYLYSDINENTKWVLEERNMYTERSGITINPAESINAVLKRFTKNKELKAQVIVLTL